MNNKELGKLGEKLAADFLRKKGYKIIDLNYRSRFGEIDIVTRNDNTYVFIEVKSRRNTNFGRPIEAIHKTKINRFLKTVQFYINEHNIHRYNLRVDAIEIIFKNMDNITINHIENITC